MKLWKKVGIVLLLIITVLFMCACGKAKDVKKKDDSKETELILPENDTKEEYTEKQSEALPKTGNADTTQNGTNSMTDSEQGEEKEENDITDDLQKDNGEITLPYVPFS